MSTFSICIAVCVYSVNIFNVHPCLNVCTVYTFNLHLYPSVIQYLQHASSSMSTVSTSSIYIFVCPCLQCLHFHSSLVSTVSIYISLRVYSVYAFYIYVYPCVQCLYRKPTSLFVSVMFTSSVYIYVYPCLQCLHFQSKSLSVSTAYTPSAYICLSMSTVSTLSVYLHGWTELPPIIPARLSEKFVHNSCTVERKIRP